MDRRGFLKTLLAGVAVAGAVREFPFRVYSFPSDIQVVKASELEKVITAMAGRQFELCDWNGGPSRWVPVDMSRPFWLIGGIPHLGSSRIVGTNVVRNPQRIVITDS